MTVPGGVEEAHSPDLRSLQPSRWTPEASIQQPPSRASQARWRWASGCEVRSSCPRPKRSVLDRKSDMPYDTVGQDVGLLPDGYRRVDPTAGFLQGVLELRRGFSLLAGPSCGKATVWSTTKVCPLYGWSRLVGEYYRTRNMCQNASVNAAASRWLWGEGVDGENGHARSSLRAQDANDDASCTQSGRNELGRVARGV